MLVFLRHLRFMYETLVKNVMAGGNNHIDKASFIQLHAGEFLLGRVSMGDLLGQGWVKSGFLQRLRLHTPTTSPFLGEGSISSASQTP